MPKKKNIVKLVPTRRVLFEKFDWTTAVENFVIKNIEDCLFYHQKDDIRNRFYFVKNEVIIMENDINVNGLFVNLDLKFSNELTTNSFFFPEDKFIENMLDSYHKEKKNEFHKDNFSIAFETYSKNDYEIVKTMTKNAERKNK